MSQSDLRQALELSLQFLPQLIAHPENPEVRIQLGVASVLANRAADAPSRGESGFSTTLDREIRYHHEHVGQGFSRSVIMAAQMRRNRGVLAEGQARLAGLMGVRTQGLSDIVLKCLEKDPDNRYQNVDEIIFALNALSGTPASSVRAAGQAQKSPTVPETKGEISTGRDWRRQGRYTFLIPSFHISEYERLFISSDVSAKCIHG